MANYIFGRNTVTAYLKSNNDIKKLYLFNKGQFKEIVDLSKKNRVPFEFVDKHRLDKMVDGVHQGMVLEIEDYKYYSIEEIVSSATHNLIVVCDQLEDPHNLGAILRTADAVGVDGVVIGKHRSVGLGATVAKVSTGAINTVKVHEAVNMVNAIKELKNLGYWIIAAENGVEAVDYTEFPVDMPIAIVVGSEGKGVSRLVVKESDILTTIPMNGSVNYDIARRRR